MTSDTTIHPDLAEASRASLAQTLLPPLLASAICLLAGLGALAAMGFDAGSVLRTVTTKVLWPGDWTRRLSSWSYVFQYATPILLTGLAVAVAFQASVWNIGAQGQYLVGAIAATAVGIHLPARGIVSIPAILLAGMLAGAMLASIAAFLEWWRRVPVVLSTLLLNFVAAEVLRYLLQGPMREPGGQAKSRLIAEAASLPLIPQSRLHAGFFVALAAAAAVGFMMRQTTFGFQLRIVGANPTAARFAGIRVPLVALATLAISGALAGLAGAVEISGVTYELLLSANDSGFGFTGIAVALLGRLRALGVVAAALFFGFLNTVFRALQAELDVPFVTAQAIQGLLVILMLVLTHPRVAGMVRRSKD